MLTIDGLITKALRVWKVRLSSWLWMIFYFFLVDGIRGHLRTEHKAWTSKCRIQSKFWKSLANKEGQLCSICPQMWLPEERGLRALLAPTQPQPGVVCAHHLIPIHICFCAQLSSTWVQIFLALPVGRLGRTWSCSWIL